MEQFLIGYNPDWEKNWKKKTKNKSKKRNKYFTSSTTFAFIYKKFSEIKMKIKQLKNNQQWFTNQNLRY